MKEDLISIGEMSNICQVSKRTLRYYDVIGLVKPAYINTENGYRFYEAYQVGRIHLVKQLQELGVPLNDVSECVREHGTEIKMEEFNECIKVREREIEKEIQELERKRRIAKQYLSEYEEIKEQINNVSEEVHVRFIDQRYLICKKFTGKLKKQMFGPTFAQIGSYLQREKKRVMR